jgi:hypothetical protein
MKMRSKKELEQVEEKMSDILWYNRHMYNKHNGLADAPADILITALANAEEIRNKYNEDELYFDEEFDWGMFNGKLSAIRWMLGYDWDMLDS